jgi:hypothetical protein
MFKKGTYYVTYEAFAKEALWRFKSAGKSGSQWDTSGQKTLVTIPAKLFVISYKLIYFLFPEGFKNIL